jgi:hypothetical protein
MPRILLARSTPITASVVRFTDPSQVEDILQWLHSVRGVGFGFYQHRETIFVDTSRGREPVRLGDYIVALPQKRFAVLDPIAFEEQYSLIGFDE